MERSIGIAKQLLDPIFRNVAIDPGPLQWLADRIELAIALDAAP
jgi:hypothetical protein